MTTQQKVAHQAATAEQPRPSFVQLHPIMDQQTCTNVNAMLVQDFVAAEDTFYLGVKSLNTGSVHAAQKKNTRVVPVVARHLCREIPAEACWSGGRIDPSRSSQNYSLLDGSTTAAAITARAIAVMDEHGVGRTKKVRKDQIMAVELVFSLPPGFKGDLRGFFVDSLKWTETHFPHPARVIAAIVHLDEAAPHAHIVVVPLAAEGRLGGHALVGFKGMRNKRINLFHKEVAQGYGLRKPRPKAKLSVAERELLVDQIMRILAVGAAWASPEAVKALRKRLAGDPMPLAQALGLLAQGAPACGLHETTADAVDVANDGTTLAGDATALLCNAVGTDQESAAVDSSCSGQRVEAADAPVQTEPEAPDPDKGHFAGKPTPAIATASPAAQPDDAGATAELEHDQTADEAEPTEAWQRQRDADQAPDCWDADRGEFVTPAPKPASGKARAETGVRAAISRKQDGSGNAALRWAD